LEEPQPPQTLLQQIAQHIKASAFHITRNMHSGATPTSSSGCTQVSSAAVFQQLHVTCAWVPAGVTADAEQQQQQQVWRVRQMRQDLRPEASRRADSPRQLRLLCQHSLLLLLPPPPLLLLLQQSW